MQTPIRTVSPGVARLIPPDLQEIIWTIHAANPLLPSIFELSKGRKHYTQHINHLCLLPYYNQSHTVKFYQPLDNLRVTILMTGKGLLMRLSNRKLEIELRQKLAGPEQGELF